MLRQVMSRGPRADPDRWSPGPTTRPASRAHRRRRSTRGVAPGPGRRTTSQGVSLPRAGTGAPPYQRRERRRLGAEPAQPNDRQVGGRKHGHQGTSAGAGAAECRPARPRWRTRVPGDRGPGASPAEQVVLRHGRDCGRTRSSPGAPTDDRLSGDAHERERARPPGGRQTCPPPGRDGRSVLDGDDELAVRISRHRTTVRSANEVYVTALHVDHVTPERWAGHSAACAPGGA